MSRGVGLKFTGYPTDEKQFFWILAQEGCHPNAVNRILERLKSNGFDLLTVMDGLNFDWLADALKEVSVTMEYIKPLEDWEPLFLDGNWPDDVIQEVFRLRDERRKRRF